MKFVLVFCLTVFLFISLISCDTSVSLPPDDIKPTLTLALDDASCTEAWLQLNTKNLELPAQLTLKQYNLAGDSLSQIFVLNTQDTVLYIDSLLPNQTYNYQAVLTADTTIKSEKVTAQTLEPTSHNFTWQTFEFGQHSSSVLYDVAIIDENNIWAVGEIYMNDSLGNQDPIAYNAAYWNGSVWELKKINVLYRGSIITPPLYGIFALSKNEIWLSSGVPIKGDGTNWQQYHLFDMGVLTQQDGYLTKIWGTSSTNIYFVGTLGTIAYYNGTTWTKIESGTTSNINDIWGEVDQVTGERKILCAVSNISGGGEQKIISINSDNTIDTLKWSMNRRIQSIWFKGKHIIYTSGGGVFFQNEKDKWIEQTELPLYYTDRIRGKNYNDVITVGDFGFAAHFNGITWQILSAIPPANVLGSLSLKNNLVVTTGIKDSKAVIIIGAHF
ncbi:MAG: glucosyl transferase [Ignavibacteriaceae bacterium]